MTKMISLMIFDIEADRFPDPYSPTLGKIHYVVQQVPEYAYRAEWIDAAFHAGGSMKDHARSREFVGAGAGVAWARKEIYAGRIYGDVVDLIVTQRFPSRKGQGFAEREFTYEITSLEIREWRGEGFLGSGALDMGDVLKRITPRKRA